MQTGESALVERLRANDDAAFEELVRLHIGKLLSVARRILRNEDDAADAVQDAFLQVHKSILQFNAEAALAPWLRKIVVNACLMKLRTQRRRPAVALEDLMPQFTEDGHHADPPDRWQETSESLLMKSETRGAVRAAIDELPNAYRTILLLRDIEELNTHDTASMLGINDNTVKVRLHRARQALRTLLDKKYQYLTQSS